MGSPVGPIYASSLHRRDRTWGMRGRGARRVLRALTWGTAGAASAALLVQHFA